MTRTGTTHRVRAGVLAMAVALASGGHANGTTYTFTRILDGFDVYTGVGTPAIANDGTVAVRALENGVDGIRAGTGGPIMTISDVTGPANQYNVFVHGLNGGGAAFLAFLDAGPQGFFRGFGGPASTIVDNTGSFNSFLTATDANASGVVAFYASLDSGQNGIFRSDGTTTTTIIDTATSPGVLLAASASLNDDGVVGFVATQGGVRSIRTGTGGSLTTWIDNTGPLSILGQPYLNNNGLIVFWATLDAGGEGIFTTDDTTLTTIATNAGPMAAFLDFNFLVPSINDAGQVAFWASLDDGGSGMFTGPDIVADKVIRTGDALDGSIVTATRHGRGLTPTGQLCFQATLSNGHVGIYRADPVPTVIPGDVNCDGVLDLLDLDAFMLALTDPDGYATSLPLCDILRADTNDDDAVDGLDITAFLALLF